MSAVDERLASRGIPRLSERWSTACERSATTLHSARHAHGKLLNNRAISKGKDPRDEYESSERGRTVRLFSAGGGRWERGRCQARCGREDAEYRGAAEGSRRHFAGNLHLY